MIFNCGSGENTYTIKMINGVRHVHNLAPKWGEEPKLALDFVRQIGDVDAEEDEYYVFHKPRQIGKDGKGNFYLLDNGNFRIVKFSGDWKYLLEFGRKGQGPGEFSMFTFDMDVDKLGNVYVLDSMSTRLQIFSPVGKLTGGFKLLGQRSMNFRVLNSRDIAVKIMINTGNEHSLVKVLNIKGEVQKEFGTILPAQGKVWLNSINEAKIATDIDGNVYITFVNNNRIEKYAPDGKLLFVVDRPLNYKMDHKMVKPEGLDFTYPEMTVVSQDIAVDHKGRIWNLTFTAQPKNKGSLSSTLEDHTIIDLEIFGEDGVLLGSIPSPKHVNNMRIFGNRLYIIDTFIKMCVYEYIILEKDAG